MGNPGDRRKRWGVVLAGGDGVRLRPLTEFISGDDRPKQFCALYGGRSLLEHARTRAEKTVPPGKILFSLTRAHQPFYASTLADCPAQRVVQPRNRGTAAAILSSLMLIARTDPQASVVIYPSDHYYSDESAIADAVEDAFSLSRWEPDSVTIVGARPYGPEIDYGWIQTGDPVLGRGDAFQVRAFHEKPHLLLAHSLYEQGSLWNTFVMVGKVLAFLEMICSALPGMLAAFHQFPPHRSSREEVVIPDSLYSRVPYADFSRNVLSLETRRLLVHRLQEVMWSDLGDCDRALDALSRCGLDPDWASVWRARKPAVSVQHAATASAVA